MNRSSHRLATLLVASLALVLGLVGSSRWTTPDLATPALPRLGPESLSAQEAQAAPYRPGRPIALVGGLLIDATEGPPRWDQTVITSRPA